MLSSESLVSDKSSYVYLYFEKLVVYIMPNDVKMFFLDSLSKIQGESFKMKSTLYISPFRISFLRNKICVSLFMTPLSRLVSGLLIIFISNSSSS